MERTKQKIVQHVRDQTQLIPRAIQLLRKQRGVRMIEPFNLLLSLCLNLYRVSVSILKENGLRQGVLFLENFLIPASFLHDLLQVYGSSSTFEFYQIVSNFVCV